MSKRSHKRLILNGKVNTEQLNILREKKRTHSLNFYYNVLLKLSDFIISHFC